MEERRRYDRNKMNCKISIMSNLRILVYNAEIENIGEGGIRILLKDKLAVSTVLDLEIFPLDTGVSIKCKGEIIWGNEKKISDKEHVFDTGVKFMNIKEADRKRIKSWDLSKQGKQEKDDEA
ncbi:MAG: PilZ domain-containing protein [Candidatus Omnitrophica bacterium]|nr:PilZ domain-containing protein [Candidatus Omnitrophota bacterium]